MEFVQSDILAQNPQLAPAAVCLPESMGDVAVAQTVAHSTVTMAAACAKACMAVVQAAIAAEMVAAAAVHALALMDNHD